MKKPTRLKGAFSLIEITIVIVILGTLLFIAVPKFSISQDDAKLTLGKSQVAAIISGIAVYHSNAILGNKPQTYPNLQEGKNKRLFESVIKGGIPSSTGDGWRAINDTTFIYSLSKESAVFHYDITNGDFECALSDGSRIGLCKALFE